MKFIRFEAVEPSDAAERTGIFGMANTLRRDGRLTIEEAEWLNAANAWFDRAYPDPATVDPALFDRTAHPGATCWFKFTAVDLIARCSGHCSLLEAHGVRWVRRESADPGTVVYEDGFQVVVVPHPG